MQYALLLIVSTPIAAALSQSETQLYNDLAKGVEISFTKPFFEGLLNDEKSETAWDKKPLTTLAQKYSIPTITTDAQARTILGMSATDPVETAEKFYKKLSLKLHPDKIWNFIQSQHRTKLSTLPENVQNTLANNSSKIVGDSVFKALGNAKDFLGKRPEVTFFPFPSTPPPPEPKEPRTIEEILVSILSPKRTPVMSKWAFTFEIIKDFEEIVEFAQKNPDAISKTIIAASELAQFGLVSINDDAARAYYKDILPAVKERIALYKKARVDKKESPLEQSFKAKDINTLIDIVTYNAYLQKPDFSLPPEIDELGALIDHYMVKMITGFFVIQALENKSPKIADFEDTFSIYGWSGFHPLSSRMDDGLSWSFTIKNPDRIKQKLAGLHREAETAIRRAYELITQLEKIKSMKPSLAKIAQEKIIAIQAQLPPTTNISDGLMQFAQSLQILKTTITR